jgi:hypothetical protein
MRPIHAAAALAVALPLLALFAAGCAHAAEPAGNDDQGVEAGAGQTFPDVQSYCAARARAECTDAVARSCGAASASACASARAAYCLSSIPQGVALVSENVPPCIAIVAAAHADGQLDASELQSIRDACDERCFSGPGEARAPCVTNYDCRSRDGLRCLNGRCFVPRSVPAGAPCGGESDVCVEGYFCGDAKCVAYAEQGDACTDTLPCAPDLAPCTPHGELFGAQCRAKLAGGQPCSDDAACADGVCDKLTGATNGTCSATVHLVKPDAACATYR